MTDTDPNDVFLSLLPSVAEQVDAEWQTLKAGGTPEALLSALHRLTGTALSLGYTRLGNASRRLEEYLKQPEYSVGENLEKLVAVLRAEIQACASYSYGRSVLYGICPSGIGARRRSLVDKLFKDGLKGNFHRFISRNGHVRYVS